MAGEFWLNEWVRKLPYCDTCWLFSIPTSNFESVYCYFSNHSSLFLLSVHCCFPFPSLFSCKLTAVWGSMKGWVTIIRVKFRKRSDSITRNERKAERKQKRFSGLLLTAARGWQWKGFMLQVANSTLNWAIALLQLKWIHRRSHISCWFSPLSAQCHLSPRKIVHI